MYINGRFNVMINFIIPEMVLGNHELQFQDYALSIILLRHVVKGCSGIMYVYAFNVSCMKGSCMKES